MNSSTTFSDTQPGYSRIEDENDTVPCFFLETMKLVNLDDETHHLMKWIPKLREPGKWVQGLPLTLQHPTGRLTATRKHNIEYKRKTITFGAEKCESVTLRYQGYFWVIVIKEQKEREEAEHKERERLHREGVTMPGTSDDGNSKIEASDVRQDEVDGNGPPGYFKFVKTHGFDPERLKVKITKDGLEINIPQVPE